ncbi:MAG: insulinase family protein, partial [Verrucomicrobiota bacterium]
YLDAVFHPELKEDTFKREGHHLTLADNADLASPLKVSGIVYNEMKGAYSSPESLMYELVGNYLYPDTPLGRNSGGDPERIPELTYQQFQQFHAERYHPSNALIYIYGDIPTADHFNFLAPVLNGFQRREAHLTTPRQPRWTAQRRIEKEYPIGTAEETSTRTFFTLNWLVGDALDPALVTDWEVLARLLIGNDASPLKKALIDSKLGTDIFFAGTGASAYEQEFHVGLKGSEPNHVDAFEKLVFDTLKHLAAEPFPKERVAAAFQQLAYDTLEVKTLFPLLLLNVVNDAWPFGADPLPFLRFKEHLAACRQRWETDPDRFNRLIRTGLLDNPHRLRIVLRPDRDMQARADAAFTAKMAEQRTRLDAQQIAGIAQTAAALQAAQGVPNSPAALAKLPQLKASDLPAKPRHIPTNIGQVAGITVLRNDVFANGVNYLELCVDLAGLPVELYSWLTRYIEVLNKMGVAGQNFATIADRRTACTGGLWSNIAVWKHATDQSRTIRQLQFGLKTLDGEAEKAFALLGDLIFAVDPRDRARLNDVMTQTRAAYRTTLVNDGLGTARRQAARGLSREAAIEHLFFSPVALRVVEELTGNFDKHADEIMQNVERIRNFLLRARWTVSFTGSDTVFHTLTRTLEQWTTLLRNETSADVLPAFQPFATPPREGLAGPMLVANCAKLMPAPHLAHPDVPSFELGIYLANFDYLLPEIRFKGNAYGGGARYSDALGVLMLYSFRDPHIVQTLATFDGLRAYIAAQHWSQTDIDRAIIGSAKEEQKPIRPGAATGSALVQHLRGDTNELREKRYAATLRATPVGVKETMLRLLDANESRSAICVVSSREKLAEANHKLGKNSLSVSDILP